jgi:hypothetical protein
LELILSFTSGFGRSANDEPSTYRHREAHHR